MFIARCEVSDFKKLVVWQKGTPWRFMRIASPPEYAEGRTFR